MTVTPGKKIFVSFVEDVLWMSSGQFVILGGSRSVCKHNNNNNNNDDDDDEEEEEEEEEEDNNN